MNATRPTSSKGRSRAAVSSPPCAGGTDGGQGAPEPGYGRPDRNLRSRSQPAMWEAGGPLSQQEVLQLLRGPPAGPLKSLNKYKVLPSIERRRPEESPPGRGSLDGRMSRLHLSEAAAGTGTGGPEADERPDDPDSERTGDTGRLLLAVRAPCGRRFQQHFEPTDPLGAVRASAEARYGTRYGEVSIETMDVPRRTFTNLDVTLAQSGILNRSVLFISQRDSDAL